jgi:hypothetical protein
MDGETSFAQELWADFRAFTWAQSFFSYQFHQAVIWVARTNEMLYQPLRSILYLKL